MLSWAGPAALCGQLLILVVCGRSIPIWHHCRCQLEQRNAGQGRSSKPVRRRPLAVMGASDAPYGELPYLFNLQLLKVLKLSLRPGHRLKAGGS